jgi:hypothetical protein
LGWNKGGEAASVALPSEETSHQEQNRSLHPVAIYEVLSSICLSGWLSGYYAFMRHNEMLRLARQQQKN